ncbi:TIGR00270 family protein [Candidatus Woesearchaeota archaeon]|nr:TIGR00270 family protein [Candidatus Woesearchaeota archaeon]
MVCEMCGNAESRYIGEVEGSKVTLCEKCRGLAENVTEIPQEYPKKKKENRQISENNILQNERGEYVQMIVPGFHCIVKNAREKTGLKQKEFAQKIGEKESLVHKIESGQYKPSIPLARKLERALQIHLVETVELKRQSTQNPLLDGEEETFTLGHFIKKRT